MSNTIRIRAVVPDDAEGICVLESLPQYRAGTLRLPYPSLASVRSRLADPDPQLTMLVAEGEGKVLGLGGLRRLNGRRSHVGQVVMGVHDDHQGRGIGSALLDAVIDLADNWLNLQRLELEVYVDNSAAIHLYRKAGFLEEGILRQFAFRDGHYVDAMQMGRLRQKES